MEVVFLLVLSIPVLLLFKRLFPVIPRRSYDEQATAFLEKRKLKVISIRKPDPLDWNTSPYPEYDSWTGFTRVTCDSFRGSQLNGYPKDLYLIFRIAIYEYEGHQETAWIKIEPKKPFEDRIAMKII